MAGANGNGRVVPAAYPPPVDTQKEFIKRELDAEDERIEVGVAIVGGGTAGLATANRLLQLLADDAAGGGDLMERLGEVPVAVIEKAKTCGGHNLSGAVVRPGPLEELFPEYSREDWRKEGWAYGEVHKEAVYMTPTSKLAIRIPPPPPFKNHGNEVISVSALARFQQRLAEEGGGYVLTETAATQLLVEDGRVRGVRSGDKGRGKDGEPLGNFEPGTDITAQFTVLAEGCWGHLTGPAIREFDLAEGAEPQTWELGVKEVWKVPKPLDRLIHTIGPWPVKISAKYGQIGGTWIYPMKDEKTGDDLVSIGFVVDLDYADATTSAHDLLQQFKLHPLVRKILEGGERVAWGAKALPGGGYWSMPKLTMKGAPLVTLAIATKGKLPPGRLSWHRQDEKPMFIGDTKDGYPKPDGKYTFDKLSSVYITGNATRDDAPNHIRVRKRVPREVAETWAWMCPAGVYEIPDDAPPSGSVDVIVNYTNCVQCGAITAKGGRLTTPEGGDGPLYQLT